jgi:hypothetical protein
VVSQPEGDQARLESRVWCDPKFVMEALGECAETLCGLVAIALREVRLDQRLGGRFPQRFRRECRQTSLRRKRVLT